MNQKSMRLIRPNCSNSMPYFVVIVNFQHKECRNFVFLSPLSVHMKIKVFKLGQHCRYHRWLQSYYVWKRSFISEWMHGNMKPFQFFNRSTKYFLKKKKKKKSQTEDIKRFFKLNCSRFILLQKTRRINTPMIHIHHNYKTSSVLWLT